MERILQVKSNIVSMGTSAITAICWTDLELATTAVSTTALCPCSVYASAPVMRVPPLKSASMRTRRSTLFVKPGESERKLSEVMLGCSGSPATWSTRAADHSADDVAAHSASVPAHTWALTTAPRDSEVAIVYVCCNVDPTAHVSVCGCFSTTAPERSNPPGSRVYHT